MGTKMIVLARASLVTLLVAVAPGAAARPLAAQSPAGDSLRQAYLARIEAYRRQLAGAAAVFADRARPAETRLAAVSQVATFDEAEHVAAGTRIAFDPAEPVAVRVRALQLVGHRASDPRFLLRLLEFAADSGNPRALRHAAMGEAAPAFFGFHPVHGGQDGVFAALRRLVRDPDVQIRRPALRVLAEARDPEALRMLEDGLRTPGQGPLPPGEAVQLLGVAGPAEHFPVLRQLLAQPADSATRIMAIHLLAEDAESRPRLVAILQSGGESVEARTAALGALLAGDPDGLARYALPVVASEAEPADLRVRAIKAMELRRTTRDAAAARRPRDAFDQGVERAAQSRDAEVQAAARMYLDRTRSPR